MNPINLKTLPAIAREHGCTQRQAEYAVNISGITETARIGIVRVFDGKAAQKIKDAIDNISGKRPAKELAVAS